LGGSAIFKAKVLGVEPKLSVGDTLSRTFSIYRDQAGVLLPVAFWLFLAVAILEAALGESLAILAVALLTLVLTFLYQGMVVGLVRDVQDGRRDNSIKELVLSVLPVLMPLIGAGILTAIGIIFGFILLVVPGLFLLTIWAVTAPVIVVERRGVFDSLGRSRQLVRGNGWPVLGAFLLAILISIVASIALSAVGNALSDTTIMDAVFYALSSTVTAPIEGLVASVLYFRLLELQSPPASDSSASAAAPEPPAAS
jgi:hypothetical protein